MPRAAGTIVEPQKYAYEDHDADVVSEVPPVQNTWYEVFDADDVRLIWCYVYQENDEVAAKTVEMRWTIDGTVYFVSFALLSATSYYVYRTNEASAGGTSGLAVDTGIRNAAYTVDKRGHAFKVEVRITAALGTNQALISRCVHETLEAT